MLGKFELAHERLLSPNCLSASLSGENINMSDDLFKERFELLAGLTLALLAAITALTDLQAGKFGDDEIMGHNQKSAAYSWYQSKSIKETAVSQELSLLRSLILAGALSQDVRPSVERRASELDDEVKRYKAEKKEILLGSRAVGEAGHVLEDKSGKKGAIIGAQEWEDKLEVLGKAGDRFDRATLWLQLSMVCGAMSLVIRQQRLKLGFYLAMVSLGILGVICSLDAWQLAGTVG